MYFTYIIALQCLVFGSKIVPLVCLYYCSVGDF